MKIDSLIIYNSWGRNNNLNKKEMKAAVFIALFGIAAATHRHESNSFIQTKFVNFNEMKDDEEEKAPSAEDLRLRAEIAQKATKVAAATKEVEADEIKDAGKTEKQKKKEAKELNEKIAKVASKKEFQGEDADAIACAKKRADEAAAKAAKEAKVAAFADMVKDKTSDMEWAANLPEDIVNHKKFSAGPIKYANVQL